MDRLLDASNQDLQKENEQLKHELYETIQRGNALIAVCCMAAFVIGSVVASILFVGGYENELATTHNDAEFWKRSSNFWYTIQEHKVSVIKKQDDEIDKLKYENAELVKWNKEWAAKAILCKIWGPDHNWKVPKEKVAEMLKQELDGTNMSIQVP